MCNEHYSFGGIAVDKKKVYMFEIIMALQYNDMIRYTTTRDKPVLNGTTRYKIVHS